LLLETEASTERFLAPLRQLAPEVLQAVAAGAPDDGWGSDVYPQKDRKVNLH
jgi:hypothetical protein